jgi:hypothetical protein
LLNELQLFRNSFNACVPVIPENVRIDIEGIINLLYEQASCIKKAESGDDHDADEMLFVKSVDELKSTFTNIITNRMESVTIVANEDD